MKPAKKKRTTKIQSMTSTNPRFLRPSGKRSKFEERLHESAPKGLLYEPFKIPYTWEANYIPDFVWTKRNGEVIIIEAKGYFRPGDKRKMIAVKRCNPELDIRFVLPTRPTDKDIRWCERHKFPWSAGKFNMDWFKE